MLRRAVAMALLCTGVLVAQDLNLPAKPRNYVRFVAEPGSVTAGKSSVVELHFRVEDGFHINSHTPRSESLIPTAIALQPTAGIAVQEIRYPAGVPFAFSFAPKEMLDVYAGDFVVKVNVLARAGSYTVDGTLHYQACDHAQCFPPKTLPIRLFLTAK